MKTNAHESAFPVEPYWGLTKREYFAGLAMQNLQNVLLRKSGMDAAKEIMEKLGVEDLNDAIAKLAVIQADALIKELNND